MALAELEGSTADSQAGERWLAHMLGGNFAAAWLESDAIRRRGAPDPHRFWQGEDIRGKQLILRCLHGYGDAVQFLRYAPRLRALASHLVVEVPPAMVEIAPYFDGVDDVITWGSDAPRVPISWEVQAEIMELPYLFRTEAGDLPIATRYLGLPATVTNHASAFMASSSLPRVGVVWAAGEWNRNRALPLSKLRPLFEAPGFEFWSLQGGEAARALQVYPWAATIWDVAVCGEGILPLAAAISQLDLVITVDTLAAHLAGALGKPVWIMLLHTADWRWMTDRDDSPWYPSARLFRQEFPGDWDGVVASVQRHLAQWQLTHGQVP